MHVDVARALMANLTSVLDQLNGHGAPDVTFTATHSWTVRCGGRRNLISADVLGSMVEHLGLPDRFIDHGEQSQLLAELGLDKDGIVGAVRARTIRQ